MGRRVAGEVNGGRVSVRCSLPVFLAQCPKRKLFLHFVCSLKKFLKTQHVETMSLIKSRSFGCSPPILKNLNPSTV